MLTHKILSWSFAAIVASFTLSTGSVDRNSTLSHNNNPASNEEVKEANDDPEYVIFRYIPPLVADPYDDIHVQDLDNWSSALQENCNNAALQEVACSIKVKFSKTVSGVSIDPSVSIEVQQSGTGNNYMVTTSLDGSYFDEINKPIL